MTEFINKINQEKGLMPIVFKKVLGVDGDSHPTNRTPSECDKVELIHKGNAFSPDIMTATRNGITYAFTGEWNDGC